jgi:phosphoglycolate phosphatase-like HAD superfamily hydrolase
MIRNLIWDAGGTLFDSYPAKIRAFGLALAESGVAPHAPWIAGLLRQSTQHCIQTLAESHQLDAGAFERRYRAHYDGIGPEAQPPFPGVVTVLRYICDIGGQNFIATHRERESLHALLTAHHMAGYFAACITKDDPYPRKPDPTAIEALLTSYGLSRGETMLIGDRDLDIQAGKNAGIRTCFFGAEPHRVRADVEAEDFGEFYRWLKAENALIDSGDHDLRPHLGR